MLDGILFSSEALAQSVKCMLANDHVSYKMTKAITRRMRVEEERHTALESRLLAARASCFLGAHALAVVTSAADHFGVGGVDWFKNGR